MFKNVYFLRERFLSPDCEFLCIKVSGFRRYWKSFYRKGDSALESLLLNMMINRGLPITAFRPLFTTAAKNIREDICKDLNYYIPKKFTKEQLDGIINHHFEKAISVYRSEWQSFKSKTEEFTNE